MSTSFDLVGVVHLLPLPGGPQPSPGLEAVLHRARHDARVLVEAGFDGIIIENFGDAPFGPGAAEPHVLTAMTAVAVRVADDLAGRAVLGINVLRNDAVGALSVALACGAHFVRVNVLNQATWTDQGLIQGRAREVLTTRRHLGLHPLEHPPGVRIFADVLVKHGVPAGQRDPVVLAREAAGRAGADVLIVTGEGTGRPVEPEVLAAVGGAVEVPVWVGSGLVPDLVGSLVPMAQGAIVGTWLHERADITAPLCPQRSRELVAAVRAQAG